MKTLYPNTAYAASVRCI